MLVNLVRRRVRVQERDERYASRAEPQTVEVAHAGRRRVSDPWWTAEPANFGCQNLRAMLTSKSGCLSEHGVVVVARTPVREVVAFDRAYVSNCRL